MKMLESIGYELKGKHAVVIGVLDDLHLVHPQGADNHLAGQLVQRVDQTRVQILGSAIDDFRLATALLTRWEISLNSASRSLGGIGGGGVSGIVIYILSAKLLRQVRP
jgi:hypothetical protein